MKVGFIVECGPQGAETQVVPYLARMIDPRIESDVIPLDRKPVLKRECGRWARALLAGGCRRVIIVWDLLPDWGEYEGKGCRHDDKEEVRESLRLAGINPADSRVRLVCIEKMLEAWLIADGRALSAFLSTAAHRVRIPHRKNSESITDPKAALIGVFRKSGSHFFRYVDRDHAKGIARQLPDLSRLRKLDSFAYFERHVTEAQP